MCICRERERDIQKMRNTDIDTSPIVEISEIIKISEMIRIL